MPYTFPTSSIAEPFYNPFNRDFLSRVWRARQEGTQKSQLNNFPVNAQLTASESVYYYKSDTK